jgi:anti-anti-sigma factor
LFPPIPAGSARILEADQGESYRMATWILRPRFEHRDLGDELDVEILEVTPEGEETSLETLHLMHETSTEIWPSEGILERLVQTQLDQNRPRLILDLETLEKADSSGIGEIVAAVHRASVSGGHLLLVNLPRRIQEIFQRTELDRLLPIFDTVAEARHHFES